MSASVFPPARGPLDALASGGVVGARHAIDHLDDAVVVMAGLRRRLVGVVAHGKRVAGLPLRDGQREAQVLSRARQVAARVAVPNDTADALMRVLISDACRQQAQSVPSSGVPAMPSHLIQAGRTRMLGLLPPPRRWQPLLRRLPRALHAPLVVRVLARALRCLDPASLDLVRGSATDLLLLASRLEDADTLFFQRRLVLTGDTELGLTVRNLLDRLPWEELPLGLRIPLQRSSLLLRAARDAHRRR